MMRVLRLNTWKALPVIVLTVFLSACTNQLAYNTLPFWIDYYLSDYVTLTSKQQTQLDNDLEAFHQWHRATELPKLQALLVQLERDMSQPLSYSQVRAYHSYANERILASLEGLTPAIATLIRSLNDEQAAQWLAVLSENIEEAVGKANKGSLKAQQERRQEKLVERAEFWIESVGSKQSQQFFEMATYQIEMRPVFYAIRDDLMGELTLILTERNAPNLESRINDYFARLVTFQSDEHQSDITLYLARRYELLQRIDKHLSDEQRTTMRKKLASISSDISALVN
ncbi:DUF6279 family lipoprotein [Enterovibrio sp. ZSDZ35]|uniref:DUF6279 family lipoprotein n=1 Tax=Enterovibrio qingdaonensis TaxID=2899818 RepID=A0ABT5QRE2_9GAMM|nr:DUF6279 family lipoprotein [Enterovibrio sp. ZSDZ35]MDD1782866.1 DUF6279 family lipoprotein [Enterovibrio sp. ZSDZ35]